MMIRTATRVTGYRLGDAGGFSSLRSGYAAGAVGRFEIVRTVANETDLTEFSIFVADMLDLVAALDRLRNRQQCHQCEKQHPR